MRTDESDRLNALTVAGVKGDGVNDDAAGIQAALDSGAGTVYLPHPPVRYVIGRTLRIHSGQTLQADRHAVIRLADGADAHMLANADPAGGDRGIRIVGGIWDGNNAHQTPHGPWRDTVVKPGEFLGVLMQLVRVKDLYIGGLTFKDPESFSVQMGDVHQFTVEDVTFDHNMLRPNMDGIHVHGPASHGRIVNLKGATNDDQVALNADDGGKYEITRGPITDICIDGVWAQNGYTAVRLLSAGSPVSRIRISNIFGTFRYHVVSFTHHYVHPGQASTFQDVVIDGIFCAKPPPPSDPGALQARASCPQIWFAPGTATRNAHISNLHRTETGSGTAGTVVVDADARVDHLTVSDSSVVNVGETPLTMVTNAGNIGALSLANVSVTAEGGGPRGSAVENRGAIGRRGLTNVVGENVAAVEV